jgi:hypothetical protein
LVKKKKDILTFEMTGISPEHIRLSGTGQKHKANIVCSHLHVDLSKSEIHRNEEQNGG